MKPFHPLILALLLVTTGCAASAGSGVTLPSPSSSSPSASPGASPTASARPATALPSLLYQTLDSARGAIGRLHLDLHVIIAHKATISYLPGTVLGQRPPAGTAMKPKEAVYVTVSSAPACDPSYPTVCIPPFKGHLECRDIAFRNFVVRAPDTYHFDRDRNGIGCPNPSGSPIAHGH